MRVLVWQWGRFGYGPRFAFELEQALARFCGYPTLLSLSEDAELMRSAVCRDAVDLPIHTYASSADFIRRSLQLPKILRPVLRRLEAEPPDVAVVPMLGYWDIVFMRALRRMNVPVVSIAHDVEVHPGDRFHLLVRLQRRMFGMSQGVITLTDFVARQLRSHVELGGKVRATIPLSASTFADLELPPPQLPEATAGRPLRLLMAGRLKRYKGLELLAEALTLVRPSHAVTLRIVGAPQTERDLDRLRALPDVEFDLGWKSDQEIIAHLDWADAAVLPYVEASQSGLAPISFSRARPIIATPVGGLPEQVRNGETGIVTEAVSPASLATAIRRFAEDRALLRRYGENALLYATTELGWEQLAPRYAEVLEQTVASQADRQVSPEARR
jgi:glycosyltransferase involved in cell wall biosynthesis